MIKRININLIEAEEILYYELQGGFYIEAKEGISLISFLTDNCRLSDKYISNKIKTIFHNGNPVDDLKTARLRNGSVIALSGAMPGLVGAMMRIGSPYAAMRESITEKGGSIAETGRKIEVMLKLFNVVLKDLAGKFISRGVIMERAGIIRIIKKIEERTGSAFNFKIDNEKINSSEIAGLNEDKYIITVIT